MGRREYNSEFCTSYLAPATASRPSGQTLSRTIEQDSNLTTAVKNPVPHQNVLRKKNESM